MAVFLLACANPTRNAPRSLKVHDLFYSKSSLFVPNTGYSEDGFEQHFLPVAKAYGRSPKNTRRYSKRKAVVEAEGRPPRTLQSATNEAIARRIRAHQRAMD
jgi:hypothetical protein